MNKVSTQSDEKNHLIHDHYYPAQTLEAVRMPSTSGYAERVEGRSYLARLDINLHQTAPKIHFGDEEMITLEILTHKPFPILVTMGDSIFCQLVAEKLNRPPEREL